MGSYNPQRRGLGRAGDADHKPATVPSGNESCRTRHGSYKTWAEYVAIREGNARKRAVRAALNGTGPALPGSYAACPSTNPQAVDVARTAGVVRKQPQRLRIKESAPQKPDYSLDRWVKRAQDLGDDVNALVGHAKGEEERLDREKADKDKKEKAGREKDKARKPDPPEPPEPKADKDKEAEDEAWKRLKDIHAERQRADSGDSPGASGGRPPKSSGRSSSTSPSRS